MICKTCGKDKPIFSFGKHVTYRRNKAGVLVKYEYDKTECKQCYSTMIHTKYYSYVKKAGLKIKKYV